MTRPPLCIHCRVPLKEPIVELHEECTSRLERLWHIVKSLADRGVKSWKWEVDSDEIWTEVSHTLYAPWAGRVFKITTSSNGELQHEDVTESWSMQQKSLSELQQTNQTLNQRIEELEQQIQAVHED